MNKIKLEIVKDNLEHFLNVYEDYHFRKFEIDLNMKSNELNMKLIDLFDEVQRIINKRDQDSYEKVSYELGYYL